MSNPKKLSEKESMLTAIEQLKNSNFFCRPTDAEKLGVSFGSGIRNVGVGSLKLVYNLCKGYEEFKRGVVLGLFNLAQNIKEKEKQK